MGWSGGAGSQVRRDIWGGVPRGQIPAPACAHCMTLSKSLPLSDTSKAGVSARLPKAQQTQGWRQSHLGTRRGACVQSRTCILKGPQEGEGSRRQRQENLATEAGGRVWQVRTMGGVPGPQQAAQPGHIRQDKQRKGGPARTHPLCLTPQREPHCSLCQQHRIHGSSPSRHAPTVPQGAPTSLTDSLQSTHHQCPGT